MRAQLLLSFAAVVSLVVPQAAPSADELARALQAKYAGVSDFSANFVHSYRGGVLKKAASERGTVVIKKPARMRWVYESPEKKIFVADGMRVYSYIPEDRQVIVSRVPAEDEATTPALFLTGKGNLQRDFMASIVPPPAGAPPDTWAVKFTPRRHEVEYEWMVLVVERSRFRIRTLITADAQGGQSTFVFTNIRENVGVSDKEFQFTIPHGVDVINNAQPGR